MSENLKPVSRGTDLTCAVIQGDKNKLLGQPLHNTMTNLLNTLLIKFLLLIILLTGAVYSEEPSETMLKIKSNSKWIHSAAELFDIDANCLAAVIYAERSLNYDWKDDALDVLYAKTGYNSSIGFCQVKLKTAYWIEKQLADSMSHFYAGHPYRNRLSASHSPGEIIAKLANDSLNIIYAAAYIRIIQSFWAKAGFPIDDRPGIIGTLYSTGLFKRDGTIRQPHAQPEPTSFGVLVSKSLLIFR